MQNAAIDRLVIEMTALIQRAFQEGVTVGARSVRDAVIVAAGGSVPDEPSAPKDESAAVVKAPRGSVEKVVNWGFDKFPQGLKIKELALSMSLDINDLPTVSDGSIRNYLRKLESLRKAHRVGDVWYRGPSLGAQRRPQSNPQMPQLGQMGRLAAPVWPGTGGVAVYSQPETVKPLDVWGTAGRIKL